MVDDGSRDGTADAARRGGADQVVEQPVNRGKGAAVRAGMLVARGRTVAFTDADLAYPPVQLLALLDQVESGWDVVVGSRRHVETSTLVRARRLREMTGPAVQPADPGRAAGPVPRHPVRHQGVPVRRGPPAVRPRHHRPLRVRRGAVPPGRALPPVAHRGAGHAGQHHGVHRAGGTRRRAHGARPVPDPPGR